MGPMDGQNRSGPELKRTADFDAIRALALSSGLEDGIFENIITAYGYYFGPELVGCIALKKDGSRYSIEWLAVVERMRSKGVGSLLVKTIENEARVRGADRLWALARAPRFFEKMGYRTSTMKESGGPSMSNCMLCQQYERTCFPAVMVKKL